MGLFQLKIMRISSTIHVGAALFIGSTTAFSPLKPSTVTRRHTRLYDKQQQDSSTTVMEEANEALTSVGWAPPSSDAELTSDDPFVQQIDASIQQDFGVGLDELLNPAKVSLLIEDSWRIMPLLCLPSTFDCWLGCQFGTRLVQSENRLGVGNWRDNRDRRCLDNRRMRWWRWWRRSRSYSKVYIQKGS